MGITLDIHKEMLHTYKQITKLWLQAHVAYDCEEREEKK